MALLGKWTQHLPTQHEREKFSELVQSDTVVLGRLLAIIEEFENELISSEISIDEYSSPSFAYLKADRNGEHRAYYKIKKLLQHLKE
jgi:hypothetical protein